MAEPLISAQILRHITNCLALTGRSSEALLERYGLASAELQREDQFVPLRDYLAFFEQAAHEAKNPHFGLYAARLIGTDSLGSLSLLFLSAPTLRTAFQGLTHFLDVVQQATHNRFFENDRHATFEYRLTDAAAGERRQDVEYSIAATFNLVRRYIGCEFKPFEVRFEHDRVGDYARYREYFGCDVYFGHVGNTLVLPNDLLDATSASLSVDLFPIIEGHLHRRLSASHSRNVAGRVSAIVEATPLDHAPSLDETARQLDLSTATLVRRLRGEGTSFGEIVMARRMGNAERLLKDTRRSISDIALHLGYAESASFIRSFRKRYGTTPYRFRLTAASSRSR